MRRPFAFLLGFALVVGACGEAVPETAVARSTTATPTTATPTTATPRPETLPWPSSLSAEHQEWTTRVVARIPHDPAAYTQGLEMTEHGLLESTGRRGESTLRRIDAASGSVTERRDLEPTLFGEGLTVSDDEIIQLTWEAGQALRYDATTLEPIGVHSYAGEGWGICAGPTDLWMSDGSADLQRRDPASFELLDSVTVRRDGSAVDDLNELECIGDHVVANVWKSDDIVVIEPASGAVVATIDAHVLAAEIGTVDEQAVLNGIADRGDGTLLLGGKLWPTLFVVVVEPVA
jgi:glutamine cyclotransferase